MGKDKLTISDIAEALGVSKTTVSRALSGKGRISKATIDKVNDYVQQHHYQPYGGTDKALAFRKTHNIAVTWSGDYELVEMPYFQNVLTGIVEVMSDEGYDVMISLIVNDHIENLKRVVDKGKIDGVILTRTLVNDFPSRYLKNSGIPFVCIGSSDDKDVIQIDNDHFEACRELTSALIHQGHKRIALIGGSSNHIITKTRYGGFVKAFHDNRVTLDTSIIFLDINTDKRISDILSYLLTVDVDCLICMDDTYALRVIDICKNEHIRISEDLRIASFYNSTLLSGLEPAVTSLDFNDRNLGAVAARTLLQKIKGGDVQNRMLKTYEVMLRESTRRVDKF